MINIKDYHTLPEFLEALSQSLQKKEGKVLIIDDKKVLFQVLSIKEIERRLVDRIAGRILTNPELLEEEPELWE